MILNRILNRKFPYPVFPYVFLVFVVFLMPVWLGATDFLSYKSPNSQFEVSYPSGWDALDIQNPYTISDSLKALYAEELDNLNAMGQDSDMKILFAKKGSRFNNNFNIVAMDKKSKLPSDSEIKNLNSEVSEYVSSTFGATAKNVVVGKRKVGKYHCVVMQYEVPIPDSSVTMAFRQYMFNSRQRSFVLTFTTTADQIEQLSSIFDQCVMSLKDTSKLNILRSIPEWLWFGIFGAVFGALSSLFRSKPQPAPVSNSQTQELETAEDAEDIPETDEEEVETDTEDPEPPAN